MQCHEKMIKSLEPVMAHGLADHTRISIKNVIGPEQTRSSLTYQDSKLALFQQNLGLK